MRLILDNVSKRDYEWLLSMAKALNFKVSTEAPSPKMALEQIDLALDEETTDTLTADFMTAYGISEADITEFRQRKAEL